MVETLKVGGDLPVDLKGKAIYYVGPVDAAPGEVIGPAGPTTSIRMDRFCEDSRVLKRAGLSRLKDLAPAEPVRRYKRDHPGDMIHIDIKKLGRFERVGHRITGDRAGQSNSRGVGWEFVHVAIDDASRAFSQILPDERKERAVAFLEAALAYYASLGVTVARVMTDNGSCYRSKAFARACRKFGLRHIRTRPYTPKTNGKAKRFIQTALREWAYAVAYPNSDHRAAELPDN